jgi:hypothetical protein
MKNTLNLISVAALAALGLGIWITEPAAMETPAEAPQPDPAPVADTIPDDPLPEEDAPADTAPDAAAEDAAQEATAQEPAEQETSVQEEAGPDAAGSRFTVEGVQPGYFIPSADIVVNGFQLEHVQAMQAENGFEETVSVVFSDTSRVAGTNDRGEYYETVWMDVTDYSITAEGVAVTASHDTLGTLTIDGTWDAQGYDAWTSGEDAVDRLFTADVRLGGITLQDVPFSFWIGD